MQAGEFIGNRFQLTRQLQTAWQAEDQVSGQTCLLKPADNFLEPAVANWLGQTWHAGLPRLLDKVADKDNNTCFVFEYLEGCPISALPEQKNGQLPLQILLPLMIQASRILVFLHQQADHPIYHLDVKPEHLIVNGQGEVSLIDFGAARMAYPDTSAVPDGVCRDTKRIALTPSFAAPEQLSGHPCPGSDIFALGLTMLHLLTGATPADCRSQPLRDLQPDLGAGMQRLIARCLHTDPAIRYANAGELAQDLAVELELLAGSYIQPEIQAANAPSGMDAYQAPMLTIWDGAEFGCELAAAFAEKRQVLVIDADLLNPRADMLLGIKQDIRYLPAIKPPNGLNLVLDEDNSGHLDVSLFSRMISPTQIARVSVLTNQAGLDHYEHYNLDSFNKILKLSRMVCDLVIVLCSRFIFDAFTCLGLAAADRTLVALTGDSCSFREYNRLIDFFFTRHKFDHQKVSYVAFPYNKNTDLSWGTMNELCGGHLIGCISDCEKRRKMKSGAVPYACSLERTNLQEYRSLIKRICLPQRSREVGN